NHLCYLLEQTKMLFTGDHVMQGSTVVINPPDGDMRAYLQSLEKLLDEDIAIIAPGHGYLIGAPKKELRRLIAHRLAREEKVVNPDRKAIEGKLGEVRSAAQSGNLAELASMFNGVEGMPKAQIEQRVKNALKWLADKPQHQRIATDLELVELNLKNLK